MEVGELVAGLTVRNLSEILFTEFTVIIYLFPQ